jgi:hypothetical protein
MHKQALAELQLAAKLSGGSPLYLAQVAVAQAVAGSKTDALRIAAQLEKISRERYVSPYGLAQIYAALNDKEQTFRWLQVAYDDHAVWMSYLAVDPVFDRFREDQRFQDLLRRVGLLPGSVANACCPDPSQIRIRVSHSHKSPSTAMETLEQRCALSRSRMAGKPDCAQGWVAPVVLLQSGHITGKGCSSFRPQPRRDRRIGARLRPRRTASRCNPASWRAE